MEADISKHLVPSMGQAPTMLNPTFPIMQLNCVVNMTLPACPCPSNFVLTIYDAGFLRKSQAQNDPDDITTV